MLDDAQIAKFVQWLSEQPLVLHAQRTGSTVICGTDPNTTDVDIAVLVKDFGAFSDWTPCGTDEYTDNSGFAAFRKGPFNVMAFLSKDEFEAVLWATSFAQKWGMPNKEQRYEFFEYVRKLARNQF